LNNTISILGCGWLGFPLAIQLVTSGWKVKGSTTSPNKVNLLSQNEIDPYLVQLQDIFSVKDSKFWAADVLLINIPPSLKKQSASTYLEQMRNLADVVKTSPIKRVIFISSTSVYPDLNKTITDVEEADENSALLQSEMLFTQYPSFKTTVIRFGGLIGPGRNPSRFFAGKTNIPNGNAPVNLIHLDDCLAIIQSFLQQQQVNGTYHAAAPSHPTRSEFYAAASQQAGLALPEFVAELQEWKIIDPVKLENEIGYRFIHPDLLSCLDRF
jgi:nucleoside-diphosphate-sugar epimerase